MSKDLSIDKFSYERIVDDLIARRSKLEDEPERLPSEIKMAEQYGVSRDTIRRALSVLEAQGAVIRRPKRGTFIQPVRMAVGDAGVLHLGFIPPWWSESPKVQFAATVLDGVLRWADEKHHHISVLHADRRPNEHAIWQELAQDREIRGVIWVQPQQQQISVVEQLARHLPTAIIGRPLPNRSIVQVMPDYNRAAALIDEHLFKLGHQQYVLLGKNIMSTASQAWVKAFEKAYLLRRDEFDTSSLFIDCQPFGQQRAAKLLTMHLDSHKTIGACVSLTSSYLQYLLGDAELRKRFGKDLSLVAWDYGRATIESYWPGRSIDHATCDWGKIGRTAANLLALKIAGHDVPRMTLSPVSFFKGQTSAPFRTPSSSA